MRALLATASLAAFALLLGARAHAAPPASDSPVPPPPEYEPPPPPASPPPPPGDSDGWAAPQPSHAPPAKPTGQWTYTTVLGWIWAPRGRQYVDLARGGNPHAFVYLPPGGWRWIVAPWVWGDWWPYPHPASVDSACRGQGTGLARWRHGGRHPSSTGSQHFGSGGRISISGQPHGGTDDFEFDDSLMNTDDFSFH